MIYITILILVALLSTSCDYVSLAEDLIPPPGSELPASLPTQAVQTGLLYPLVPPDPAEGEPIYLESCAPCHGTSGRGDGLQASNLPIPVKPLTSSSVYRQSTPAAWYDLITKGDLERYMPPFSGLTARQRWDVVAYAYSLSTSLEETQSGMELYQFFCAGCHGESGRGDGPAAQNLESSPTNFTDQAYMTKKSISEFYEAITTGVGDVMPSFSGQLSEDERWVLANMVRYLSFSGSAAMLEIQETEDEPVISDVEELSEEPGTIPHGDENGSDSETGSVTGVVINASGGEVPSGFDVILHGFDNMQETFTESTIVMPDGTFSFEEVDMPAGRVYIASLDYQQSTYGSDVFVVQQDTRTIQMSIHIFESISDSAVLIVDRLHIFLEYREPDMLSVTELYIISNPSSYTLVPTNTGEPAINFSLPDGAVNLRFDDGSLGERFIKTANGFGDTAVVRPGMGAHQVLYAYDLPYKQRLSLAHSVSIPVNAVIILVQDAGLKIEGDQLQESGSRDVQGEHFKMYTSNRLEPGRELSIHVSGRPKVGSSLLSGSNGGSLMIGLVAFGLALVAAGVWIFRQSRDEKINEFEDLTDDELFDGTMTDQAVTNDVDTLMDTIIALDDLYKEGELPEEIYRARRAKLKARLKELHED